MDYEGEILELDLRNNMGGKPAVMMAGLLPIFNNFDISILSYCYDRNDKRHYETRKIDNTIIDITNNNEKEKGTKNKKSIKKINIYYNNYTGSSAEQAIICLLSLKKYIKINLIGNKSAGYTSCNTYVKLNKKYGIEFPIGYMGTKTKIYKKGIVK